MSQELIDRLMAGGQQVAEGEFTLDKEMARQKMRHFQLTDPHAYVLELVQAAVLRGASQIRFRIDTDDMHMSFDGPPFQADELSRAEAAMLESQGDPSLRQLGLGLSACMALKPKFARVDSGGHRLELRPGKSDQLGPGPSGQNTRIHVRDRAGLRLGEFFSNLLGRSREADLLGKHCAFARIPIKVNGRQISGPLKDYYQFGGILIQGEGFQGAGGFRKFESARLGFLRAGVLVEWTDLPDRVLPFQAVLECEELVENVSQTGVVRDATFERLVAAARAARPEAVARLCVQPLLFVKNWDWHTQLRLELLTFATPEEVVPTALAELALWPTATGSCQDVSLRQIMAVVTEKGEVASARERNPGLELEGMPLVLFDDGANFEGLRKLLSHRVRNVTRRLNNRKRRELNRALWLKRKAEPVLTSSRVLVRRSLAGDGFQGEIGLTASGAQPRLRFLCEGHELPECRLALPLCGLEVVLSGPFTPAEDFDAVRRDEVYARAMARWLSRLAELYGELARGGRSDVDAALRGFAHLATSPPESLARALGIQELSPPDFGLEWLEEAAIFRVGRALKSLRELRERATRGPLPWVDPWARWSETETLRLDEIDRELLERTLGRQALVKQESGQPTRPKPVSVQGEQRFLERLEALLNGLQAAEGEVLVSRWGLYLVNERGYPPISWTWDGLRLNRRHPLIKELMAASESDPAALTLLASLVMSEASRRLRSPSGVEERRQGLIARSLLGTDPLFESATRLEGELEGIRPDGAVRGWAREPEHPTRAVSVKIYVESGSAYHFVGQAAACPEEGPNAFQFQIPRLYVTGQKHTVVARAEVNGRLVELSGSPRAFVGAVPYAVAPIGHLERVDATGKAFGWTLDGNCPEQSIDVHFYIDGPAGQGEFVGGLRADQPRPDVNEATGYPGHHGFTFQIPAEHLDGSQHTLYAYALDPAGGHNPLLQGAPMTFS